jgi:hypothetical protein
MTVQNQTPDIDADGVRHIGTGTGAPTLPPGGHQAANRTTLTCTWVMTDEGALVMRWTRQTPGDERAETSKAAA